MVLFCPITAFAQETNSITVLGDSISTGYGLEESELSYCGYLQEYYDAEIENFAKNGRQTSELLSQLESDGEVIDSVKNADIVCVTIGGNDVLSIFEKAANEMSTGGAMMDQGKISVSSEFIQSFIMKFSSSFGSAAANAGENITLIEDKITQINPDAQIVMQTIYNPFELKDQELDSIIKPLKSFTAIYLGVINNSVRQQPALIADIHTKLSENSWIYTNINDFDIHPNYIGHMLIAEEIIQQIGISGNSEVFQSEIDKIPEDDFLNIPESLTSELNQFIKGKFRENNTLEADVNSIADETQQEDTQPQTTETAQEKTTVTNKNKKTERKINLSDILMYTGIALVVGSVCLRIYSKKRKKT